MVTVPIQDDQDAVLIEISRLACQFARQAGRGQDAEELAQDVVLECLIKMRSPGGLPRGESLGGFIRCMVTRRAIDGRRNNRRRAMHDAAHLTGTSDSDSAWMSPESAVEVNALVKIREEVLASLPIVRRQVHVMVREHDLSYKEAAERLGISEQEVRSHIAAVQRCFRKHFAVCGIAVPAWAMRRTGRAPKKS